MCVYHFQQYVKVIANHTWIPMMIHRACHRAFIKTSSKLLNRNIRMSLKMIEYKKQTRKLKICIPVALQRTSLSQ